MQLRTIAFQSDSDGNYGFSISVDKDKRISIHAYSRCKNLQLEAKDSKILAAFIQESMK